MRSAFHVGERRFITVEESGDEILIGTAVLRQKERASPPRDGMGRLVALLWIAGIIALLLSVLLLHVVRGQ